MDAWLKETAAFLKAQYGLESSFADRVALLLGYFLQYGLNPRITSGFRDPNHQAAMRAAWDRGERQGLRARPAASSQHTATSWGRPAAKAIDITTSNDRLAAQIATALKIGAGLLFKDPDPGHYHEK